MSSQKISRREFLKISAVTLTALSVTCSGLGYVATRQPEPVSTELSIGKENEMNKSILVTYATRAGSTGEIAATVGQGLARRGYAVDVVPVTKKPDVNKYQAVVIGSPIRMGSWLSEMVNFVKDNQTMLTRVPVAAFTVHMLNAGDDEQSRANREAYLTSVHEYIQPTVEAFFLGKMELARLSFLDRLISTMMKAKDEDLRDWNAILNWSSAIF